VAGVAGCGTREEEGPEVALGEGVEGAEDAVELGVGDALGGEMAPQEQGVFLADGEGHPEQLVVAPKDVLVDGLGVLLRGRQQVGLVLEGALAGLEPDREDVLGLAPHPDEPAPFAGFAPLDGVDHLEIGQLALGPGIDPRRQVVELGLVEGPGRVADEHHRARGMTLTRR